MRQVFVKGGALCLALLGPVQAQPADLLSFAQGAMPVRLQAPPAARLDVAQAMKLIDGDHTVVTLTRPVPADTVLAVVLELPVMTLFEQMWVPRVLETPSPHQTFVRQIEVWGSAESASEGFVKLAEATLQAHQNADQTSMLTLQAPKPVRWLRVQLSGGLDLPLGDAPVWLEFSELVGVGRQLQAPAQASFAGGWTGRGVSLQLQQEGAVISGCYDKGEGRLQGTVEGRLLRASGVVPRTSVRSAFIAARHDDGQLTLLRSSNGAPFRLSQAQPGAVTAGQCPQAPPPVLGCGAVVHGIRFAFDSAQLSEAAAPLLAQLHAGLSAAQAPHIQIEGHSSSEGESGYNQALSQRRAQAVVDALVQRGLRPSRLKAVGQGEARPLAPNTDESGRSLNRRVEVRCDQ